MNHRMGRMLSARSGALVGILAGALTSCSDWEDETLAIESQSAALALADTPAVGLTLVGRYSSGIYDSGAAEIVAHDPATQRVFVVNAADATLDVLDIRNPAAPALFRRLSMTAHGSAANSVAVHGRLVAVAVEAAIRTEPGKVVFLDSRTLETLSVVAVGAVPDMLTFTPNGRYLLVANEGEPNSYDAPDSVDPEGSISIIDVTCDIRKLDSSSVRTARFSAYNAQKPLLQAAGVRIFGPNASVAQDLEPEYITVSGDSRTAWVTLQENNALAVVDISRARVRQILPLGLKDHALPGNTLDPSDRDDESGIGPAISLGNWPVKGIYQPDAIAIHTHRGQPYLVMANEGDVREWPGYREDVRAGAASYLLDHADAALLKENRHLGRLYVSSATGDLDGDGTFDEIHAFGGRSFSIRSALGDLVYDSGDDFEKLTAEIHPEHFNASHTNNTLDSRSPSKGPEPEALTLGRAWGRTYAFIGLERIEGILVYDVTDPRSTRFVNYVNFRDFGVLPGPETIAPGAEANVGDLGPEGIVFIKPEHSPVREPLLVVGNEISGTTSIYRLVKNF